MPRNPQDFLRFLAENYHAVAAMCSLHRRFNSEEEIAAFLRLYDHEDRNQARKVSKMQDLRMLICGVSEWAPPAFLVTFMQQLHDHHAMATPEVIRGWVQSLDKCVSQVETIIEPVVAGTAILDEDRLLFLMVEIQSSIQTIVGNVEESCERITNEVAEFRTLEEAADIRNRLRRLIMLHDDYLDPIVRILDTQGEFQAVTDRVLASCSRLVVLEENDPQGIGTLAGNVRRDLMWMRRQVLQRAHEAMKELGPLCEAAIRETRIAKGLNRALDAIREDNWDRLELHNRLHISDQRIQRLFSDRGVLSYIRLVLKARERQPPRLPPAAPAEEPQPWNTENLIAELTQGPDVADLLPWVQERCPGLGPDATFNLLRRIIAASPEMVHPTEVFSTYDVDCLTVRAAQWNWRKKQ
ncbi:MAG: hypothetical protein ABSG53_05270 [Thermoguttaceae bacterium]|jgi:hypothetical protein